MSAHFEEDKSLPENEIRPSTEPSEVCTLGFFAFEFYIREFNVLHFSARSKDHFV